MNDEKDLRPLTPQELLFCEAFANPESETFGNGTKSAEVAKYGQPHNAAWKLRQRPEIQTRLEEYHQAIASSLGKVMADLEFTRLAALRKQDYSTAARCSELQARRLGAFLDRLIVTPWETVQVQEYSASEVLEAKRITRLLLESGSPLPGLPPVPESETVSVAVDPMAEARRQAKAALEATLNGQEGEHDDNT